MFTLDNTTGYTDEQLNALSNELKLRLDGVEPNTDEWFQIKKAFSDEVASR